MLSVETKERTFTPSEAAVVSGVAVKTVHRENRPRPSEAEDKEISWPNILLGAFLGTAVHMLLRWMAKHDPHSSRSTCAT